MSDGDDERAALDVAEAFYRKELAYEKGDIVEHLPTLREYATGRGHVTEMGVRAVCSSWALLLGRPGRMVCYDRVRHPNVDALEGVAKRLTSFEFRQADVLAIDIEPTELLFIDTFHTYRQLWGELRRHAGRVSGHILLHDTESFGEIGEDKRPPGLRHAVSEFLSANPAWAFEREWTNNNGLMALARRAPG